MYTFLDQVLLKLQRLKLLYLDQLNRLSFNPLNLHFQKSNLIPQSLILFPNPLILFPQHFNFQLALINFFIIFNLICNQILIRNLNS